MRLQTPFLRWAKGASWCSIPRAAKQTFGIRLNQNIILTLTEAQLLPSRTCIRGHIGVNSEVSLHQFGSSFFMMLLIRWTLRAKPILKILIICFPLRWQLNSISFHPSFTNELCVYLRISQKPSRTASHLASSGWRVRVSGLQLYFILPF